MKERGNGEKYRRDRCPIIATVTSAAGEVLPVVQLTLIGALSSTRTADRDPTVHNVPVLSTMQG